MRVAFVSQPWTSFVLPVRRSDSISFWTYEVAQRLGSGATPVVYCKRLRGQITVEHDAGIEYRRVRSPEPKRIEHILERLGIRLGPSLDQWVPYTYWLGVALDIRRRGADIVHVHNFYQFVPLLRRLHPKARIVLHMHCEWLSQIDRDVAERCVAQVDRVVGCSGYITRLAQNRLPRFADRMGVLYNGVDVSAFSVGPSGASQTSLGNRDGLVDRANENEDPRVLFVGRISPEKGLHDLFDAFERVLDDKPNARLTVLGPAWQTPRKFIIDLSDDPLVKALARFYESDEDYFVQLKRRMSPRLAAAVDFPGEVLREELRAYYSKADVLVNPSLSESFGMSLIEGQVSGLPVVATKVGGMQELIRDGESGVLVAPGSPSELADALLGLLKNPELRRRLGRAGHHDATTRFTWDRIAQDAVGHYRAITKRAMPAVGAFPGGLA